MILKQIVPKSRYNMYDNITICNSCGLEFDKLTMISAIRKRNVVEIESMHSLYLCDNCLEKLRKELNNQ